MTQYAHPTPRHARNPRRAFDWAKLTFISAGIFIGGSGSIYFCIWLQRLSDSLIP